MEGTIKEEKRNKDKLHDSHSHLLKILLTSDSLYHNPIPFSLSNFITASSILPGHIVSKQCCMARIRFLVTTPYWTSTAALTTSQTKPL